MARSRAWELIEYLEKDLKRDPTGTMVVVNRTALVILLKWAVAALELLEELKTSVRREKNKSLLAPPTRDSNGEPG